MRRWKATVAHLTPAGAVRTWEGEVEADTAERASDLAVRFARRERGLRVEIIGVDLEPLPQPD